MSKRRTDNPVDRVGFHVEMRNGLRAELAKAVGASPRQARDAQHDIATPGTRAARPAAHARKAARMPR